MLGRFLISHIHRSATCSGSARAEVLDCLLDLCGILYQCGFQQHLHRTGVGYDGDAVGGFHIVDHSGEPGLYKPKAVIAVHGAGHIDQKDVVGIRDFAVREALPFQAEAKEFMFRIPGAFPEFGVDGKHLAAGGIRVIESKIVEIFLYPHSVRLRQGFHVPQASAHICIGGAIGIHRKSGHRLLGSQDESVLLNLVEVIAGLRLQLAFTFHIIYIPGVECVIEVRFFRAGHRCYGHYSHRHHCNKTILFHTIHCLF